jgi:hypothetical protein
MTPSPTYNAKDPFRSREAVPQQFKCLDGGTAGQIPGFPKRNYANRIGEKKKYTKDQCHTTGDAKWSPEAQHRNGIMHKNQTVAGNALVLTRR